MKAATTNPFVGFSVFALLLCAAPSAFAQISVSTSTQISLSTSGGTPSGGGSLSPAAGANGNGIAYASYASNLVADDTNSLEDVFFRDPETRLIMRASINTAGVEGDDGSSEPAISPVMPDGFYAVAFQSRAGNLGSIPNQNHSENIYVRFPTLGITEIISPAVGFVLSAQSSFAPSITVVQDASGRKKVLVVFASYASDLVNGDADSVSDIFLATLSVPSTSNYDPTSLTTITKITTAAVLGQDADGDSSSPRISADGRFVVFSSRATNLVSPAIVVGAGNLNIFRYDIKNGTTSLVSKSKTGVAGDGDSIAPQVSFNGRHIGYLSYATNIVGTETITLSSPFVIRYDASLNVNEQVNIAEDGVTNGAGQLSTVGISNNGRLVTFADNSGNLVLGDISDQANVYVRDFETGKITRLSTGAFGDAADGTSFNPALTARSLNGLAFTTAFESSATNLTSPSTASGAVDIFATEFSIPSPALGSSTKLETPPDVTVNRRTLRIIAQTFTLAPTTATHGPSSSTSRSQAARRSIRYEFNVTLTTTKNGRRRTVRTTTISKRNAITINKTRNGSYQIKNRARIVNARTKRTISRTGFSPTQRFKAT